MDGDHVNGKPSIDSEMYSLAEMFTNLCPSYMAMGMTYNQFWNCNTTVHKAYREAFEIRNKNNEWARHRQGAYFMQALSVALQGFSKDKTHKEKYPESPWPITQKEAIEQEQARERAGYEQALAQRRLAAQRRAEELKQKEAGMDG